MKKLTADNWLTVDPIIASGVFVRLSLANGSVEPITADDWTTRLLAVRVWATVPSPVCDQIEIARGAMIYGSLFYPLFTLGLEQLCRVTEAAARAKATQLEIRVAHKYHEVLADLRALSALTEDDYNRWTFVRRFRNVTTHASQATILAPGDAIGMFAAIVESINRLFSE